MFRFVTVIILIVLPLVSAPANAQVVIQSVDPPAITLGEPVDLTIVGQNLHFANAVLSTCDLAAQIKSVTPDGRKMIVSVEANDNSSAGINLFRLVGKKGVSPFTPIPVDRLPNQKMIADQVFELDLSSAHALYGRLSGQQKAIIQFDGKKGSTIWIDVESVRLGSSLRPELLVFDANKRQIGWSQPTKILGGDTRMALTIPENGKYTIQLHDQLYKAPGNSLFRIKLGNFLVADQVLATKEGFRASNVTDPKQVFPIHVKKQNVFASPTTCDLDLPFTGWRPSILGNAGTEHFETGNESFPLSVLKLPFTVNGQLKELGEVDQYSFEAEGRLFVSVIAARMGSPLDAVVTVFNEKNQVLGSNDDASTSLDSDFQVNVPKGSGKIRIQIKDLLGRGGQPYGYRLQVAKAPAGLARVNVDRDHLFVYPQSHSILRVEAERRGQANAIPIRLGLPDGIDYFPKAIPKGRNATFVIVSPSKSVQPARFNLVAENRNSKNEIVGYSVGFPKNNLTINRPVWMNRQMTISESDKPTYSLQASSPKPLFFYPMILKSRISISREASNKNKLRLSMETNQQVKKVKIKNKDVNDPKTTIRTLNKAMDLEPTIQEKTVWIYAPPNHSVDTDIVFLARPLRLMITDPKNPFEVVQPYVSNAHRLKE